MPRRTIERSLTDNWPNLIDDAITRFCQDAGVSRARLGAALRINATYFGMEALKKNLSHLRNVLPQACHAYDLMRITEELGLNQRGLQALRRFYSDVWGASSGLPWLAFYEDPAPSLKEAIDIGLTGVNIYHASNWQAGIEHMRRAWTILEKQGLENTTALFAGLRVGTTILDYNSFIGNDKASLPIARKLLHLSDSYFGNEKQIVRAISDAFRARGTMARHLNHDPSAVLKRFENADERVLNGGLAPEIRISPLLGQCKPNFIWGYDNLEQRTAKWQKAFALIDTADRLAGGDNPREDLLSDWMFTRMTWAEMCTAAGDVDNAKRIAGSILEYQRTHAFICASGINPHRAKWDFLEISIAAAEGKWGRVAERTRAIERTYPNEQQSRINRVQRIQHCLETGEHEAIHRVFIS